MRKRRQRQRRVLSVHGEVEDERHIAGSGALLQSGSVDGQNPVVAVLHINHAKTHVVVDISEALLSVASLFKLRPAPAANVVLAFALMANTIEARSFKPHDSSLGDRGSALLPYQMGVFMSSARSEVQIWPQNRLTEAAYN